MSLKRSNSGGKSFGGGGADSGGKIDRQDLFDELKRLAGTADAFTPVDIALAIGAAEAQVSKSLLGLVASAPTGSVPPRCAPRPAAAARSATTASASR